MAKIEIIEEILKGIIGNDNKKIIRLIEDEIAAAKAKGKINVARRLRRLAAKIPSEKSILSGQGASFKQKNSYYFNQNTLVTRIESNILMEDLILESHAKKTISDFLLEWENKEKLIKHGVYPTNRIILHGPPGTGKTKLAYAIANELDLPLVVVRLDELISSLLGKTGKNIAEIFDIAKSESVVILLDEIDTIAKHRDDTKELGELKRVVTVLLQNIDYFPKSSVLIGATNHEGLLDNAIWRRFSLRLKFALPSESSRQLLYRFFLGKFKNDVNFEMLAKLSEGFSGSMIEDVSENIKKRAILIGKNKIDDKLSIECISEFINPKNSHNELSKDKTYELCKIMKKNGFKLKEISEMTGIPYTTLDYNMKKK